MTFPKRPQFGVKMRSQWIGVESHPMPGVLERRGTPEQRATWRTGTWRRGAVSAGHGHKRARSLHPDPNPPTGEFYTPRLWNRQTIQMCAACCYLSPSHFATTLASATTDVCLANSRDPSPGLPTSCLCKLTPSLCLFPTLVTVCGAPWGGEALGRDNACIQHTHTHTADAALSTDKALADSDHLPCKAAGLQRPLLGLHLNLPYNTTEASFRWDTGLPSGHRPNPPPTHRQSH